MHDLDPLLVYAVALAESAYEREGGISPWPWALRSKHKPAYAKTLEEAHRLLAQMMAEHGDKIDVGVMQINLYWNGYRAPSPEALLDYETNIEVGVKVLAEAIQSSRGDLELGIGRFHHWENEGIARRYGKRVLAIWESLRGL